MSDINNAFGHYGMKGFNQELEGIYYGLLPIDDEGESKTTDKGIEFNYDEYKVEFTQLLRDGIMTHGAVRKTIITSSTLPFGQGDEIKTADFPERLNVYLVEPITKYNKKHFAQFPNLAPRMKVIYLR